MKRTSVLFIMLLVGGMATDALGQTEQQLRRAGQGRSQVSPDEVVSFKSDVPIGEAVRSLGELWKKFGKKVMIDRSSLSTSTNVIGVNVQAMHWKEAFDLLLRQNGYWYNEYADYIEVDAIDRINQQAQPVTTTTAPVRQPTDVGVQQPAMQQPMQQQPMGQQAMQPAVVDSAEIYANMREITISSVFFEVDRTALAQSGISFSLFRGRGLNLGIEFAGAEKIATPIFDASVRPSDRRLAVDVNAALRMFESEQLGEEIARPQVTVRSGATARFQSGQDFSIKQRDFSGNITDQFYNTGTILTVTPKYFEHDGVGFVTLQYKIEKSSATPGEVTTLVDKVDAQGVITLLDGEETFVGGLYSKDETTIREGVPILKDLPWWFFGLRYLFGFDSKNIRKKELIVLMKAEIVPLLKERVDLVKSQPAVLQQKADEMKKDLEKRSTKKN